MKKKINNLPEFDSAPQPPEAQEQFTKFLHRFYKEEWFDKPNHLAVFMHLLKNVNWHESYIMFKNDRYKVNIGECVIAQNDLAKTLKIPQTTVHRILHFFQNIGEIELRPTNGFTLVSINYLTKNKKENCERIASELRVVTSIDSIDYIKEIEKKNINEKQVFVKEVINLNKQEETDMATESINDSTFKDGVQKKKSVKVNTKGKTYVETLLDIWSEEYYLSRQIKYVVIQGKDTGAISRLLELFKSEQPDLDTQGMIDYFRNFCKQVLAISDPFIYKSVNPAFVYSQINQIRTILKDSKSKQSYSSVGQAQACGNYDLTFNNFKKER